MRQEGQEVLNKQQGSVPVPTLFLSDSYLLFMTFLDGQSRCSWGGHSRVSYHLFRQTIYNSQGGHASVQVTTEPTVTKGDPKKPWGSSPTTRASQGKQSSRISWLKLSLQPHHYSIQEEPHSRACQPRSHPGGQSMLSTNTVLVPSNIFTNNNSWEKLHLSYLFA